jgi:hypothetical protein
MILFSATGRLLQALHGRQCAVGRRMADWRNRELQELEAKDSWTESELSGCCLVSELGKGQR